MIVYYTTIWTPYHETVCHELAKRLGDSFRLVLTRPIDRNRKLGWDLCPPNEPWIIHPPESKEQARDGVWVELLSSAVVAVVGSLFESRSLFAAVDARVAAGKLTFFMGERLFKKGIHAKDFLRPYNWYLWWRLHRRYNRSNVHYLAIGQGVVQDLKFLRASKIHIWKWAYFPAVSECPMEKEESDVLRICWCGRMIPCKNVDLLIRAVGMLPAEDRVRCKVMVAGEGEMREPYVVLARGLGLEEVVAFRPLLPHAEMLDLMAGSDVYVFPSGGEEGWGVALEEAMDKCCAPIACGEAGSARDLIEDGVSGFIFNNGDAETLSKRIAWLLHNPSKRQEMGRNAWRSVQDWSPKTGAERLVSLIDASVRETYPDRILRGPCARLK